MRGVIREVRAGSGEPFVQINHPRESGPDDVGDGSFFSHLGVAGKPLDPSAPLASERNESLSEDGPGGIRDVDFSAIEVLNGKRFDRYRLDSLKYCFCAGDVLPEEVKERWRERCGEFSETGPR